MNFYLAVVSGYSLLIPGIISIFRIKSIGESYYPFIVFILLGCINEALGIFLAINGYHTIVNNNIYVLLASLSLIQFFVSNQLFKQSKMVHITLLSLCLILWLLETFVLRSIRDISSYFRIFYSFLIVLLSISTINKILVTEKDDILRNPLFLICICFVSYYTLKLIIESFLLYGIHYSNLVLNNIYNILIYVNLIINLIYALALLWIPRKQLSLLKL